MVLTLLLVIIYISFISLGLPDSLLGSTWPTLYKELNVPISYAGIISIIISGGTILSSLFSNKLIRRLGTGLVTSISVLLTAAALFGFSLSSSFIALCILAVPLGLGAGSIDAALNNYVALHYKARHMSWLHCFWGIGATMGPLIISFYLARGKWQMGYRSISIIQFVLVAILFISLPLWKRVTSKEEEKVSVKEMPKAISVKELVELPGAKSALTAFFLYCALEQTTGLWGSSFLVLSRNIPTETAAGWISLFYFGITFGRLASGFITFKLNQKQMIRAGEIIIAVGILLLLVPGTNVLLLPGFFLIGVGCAPIFPSLLHETPDNFGAQYSQAVMGIQMAFAYAGATFTPPVFGFLASHLGYGVYQFFIGIMLIFMIVMIERLHKSTKRT